MYNSADFTVALCTLLTNQHRLDYADGETTFACSSTTRMAGSNKKFKYETELLLIDPDLKSCPPTHATERNTIAFRWVGKPMNDRHFLPPGKLNPKRLNKPDSGSCALLGLSLYTTLDNSVRAFLDLEGSFNNARRAIGDHVAEGRITPDHGVCTRLGRHGHFDLHEYKDVAMRPVFKLVASIPPRPPAKK